MNLETRAYVNQSKKVWILLFFFSIVVLGVGIYLGFIKSKGFVQSTGVVISLRAEETYDSEIGSNVTYYYPTVRYTVDGREYQGELDMSAAESSMGRKLKIQYDPNDPSRVNSYSPGIVTFIIILGGVLVVLSIAMLFRSVKTSE